jgi:hypothetical protein
VDDEEFKKLVLERFDALDARIRTDREHLDHRLDAVVARLDEQDTAHDRLIEKVDRLSVAVRQSLDASEQALTAVTNLG